MKYIWITDPHFNFLPPGGTKAFGEYLVKEDEFEGVIISGDIGESHDFDYLLKQFAKSVAPRSVFFVLGNHDYYGGSFEKVRKSARAISEPNLVWLDESKPVSLDESTVLVGHQGWFDGRCGNPEKSRIIMSDFTHIRDLHDLYQNEQTFLYFGRGSLLTALRKFGVEAASEAKPNLYAALGTNKTVVFVTHFPPFKGACWHEGTLSDNQWLPWFTCTAMGEMLSEAAHAHPDSRIIVLCGHTHSSGVYDHLPNLRVLTGKAVYGSPDICGILEFPLSNTNILSK